MLQEVISSLDRSSNGLRSRKGYITTVLRSTHITDTCRSHTLTYEQKTYMYHNIAFITSSYITNTYINHRFVQYCFTTKQAQTYFQSTHPPPSYHLLITNRSQTHHLSTANPVQPNIKKAMQQLTIRCRVRQLVLTAAVL